MRVLVLGATGGSGRAAIEHLLEAGHEVTALVRSDPARAGLSPAVRVVRGDALSSADVHAAMAGQDAVLITLGISENPLRVRLLGPARTPMDVRSRGTQVAIEAMRHHRVRRLVVQTSYGVGATRRRLALVDRLFFTLILAPQIADTEVQQRLVEQSGLDYVVAQPVHLVDGPDASMPFASPSGDRASRSVTRAAVGRFLARAVSDDSLVSRVVALSGERASDPVPRVELAR